MIVFSFLLLRQKSKFWIRLVWKKCPVSKADPFTELKTEIAQCKKGGLKPHSVFGYKHSAHEKIVNKHKNTKQSYIFEKFKRSNEHEFCY